VSLKKFKMGIYACRFIYEAETFDKNAKKTAKKV